MSWLESISIILASWAIIYGIDAWRRAHIGKRQLELAENTLALFYEAKDAITHMRSPISITSEKLDLEKGENESDDKYQARVNASVVFYRYNQYQEVFNKLHASRYRFMAQISKEQAKPFDDLRSIINDITYSARMLSTLWAERHFRTQEQFDRNQERIEKYEAIFWDGYSDHDPIEPKLDKVITDIEYICQSVINGKGTLFSLLNYNIFINKK